MREFLLKCFNDAAPNTQTVLVDLWEKQIVPEHYVQWSIHQSHNQPWWSKMKPQLHINTIVQICKDDSTLGENTLGNLGSVIDFQLVKLQDISDINSQFDLGDNPQIQQLALAIIKKHTVDDVLNLK